MYKYLCEDKKEFIISKQVLRSGTSIGANIAEAFFAQSGLDFVYKLHISLKEAGETVYWLELLQESSYIGEEEAKSMIEDCNALIKLLTSSIKTMKSKQSSNK